MKTKRAASTSALAICAARFSLSDCRLQHVERSLQFDDLWSPKSRTNAWSMDTILLRLPGDAELLQCQDNQLVCAFIIASRESRPDVSRSVRGVGGPVDCSASPADSPAAMRD